MNNAQDIWNILVKSHMAYSMAARNFLTGDIDRVSILRRALHDHGPDLSTAFHLLQSIKVDELQQLFPELIFWASYSHGAVVSIRNAVKRLPKEWVISHIEEIAEPLLTNGTYDEYRCLLELYINLDIELTKRLARRAIQSTDPDIREAGEDYLIKCGLVEDG